MARELYTAEAVITGGRAEGHGWTSDGELDVQLRVPKEMGGEGGGTNPEELFAVGLDVTLPQVSDPADAVRLVAAAHELCPYSNATRGNIDVALTANGEPVG